jgi:hypothetical protein
VLNITNRDRTQVFPTYEVFCRIQLFTICISMRNERCGLLLITLLKIKLLQWWKTIVFNNFHNLCQSWFGENGWRYFQTCRYCFFLVWNVTLWRHTGLYFPLSEIVFNNFHNLCQSWFFSIIWHYLTIILETRWIHFPWQMSTVCCCSRRRKL